MKDKKKNKSISRREFMGAAAAVAAFTFVPKHVYCDGANMKVTNLPEANKYIHSEYREGWTL